MSSKAWSEAANGLLSGMHAKIPRFNGGLQEDNLLLQYN